MERLSYNRQKLEFDHIANIRELGGYQMQDGRHIKHGLLIRGGRLTHASDADIEKFRNEYHLANIFDFRTQDEVRFAPDRKVPGSVFLWLPTIDEKTDQFVGSSLPHEAYHDLANYLINHSADELVLKAAREMYPSLVHNEYSQLQYSSFIQVVSRNIEGAVYWHCSQGKDRTGLGSAYLLLALGASRELIIEDFRLSYEAYEEEMECAYSQMRARGIEIGPDQIEAVESFIGVSMDHFLAVLDSIDKQYGSLDRYLREILLIDDMDIEKLRARFLE